MAFILIALSGLGSHLFSQAISVTPQRPSFSTSAATTRPGWLELESGVTVDKHLIDSPLLLKLGATAKTEFFLGFSPLLEVSNGKSESGFGDLVFGGRVRFMEQVQNTPALAGQFSIKLPTADEDKGLGTGKVDVNVLFIASQEFPHMNVDVNAGLGLVSSTREHHLQFTGTVIFSRGFTGKMSGYAELLVRHNIESEKRPDMFEVSDAVFIGSVGATYFVSHRFALDAAVNFNVSDAPFDVQGLFGATVLLAKVGGSN
ncbi:MAG: transporter [bacterium]